MKIDMAARSNSGAMAARHNSGGAIMRNRKGLTMHGNKVHHNSIHDAIKNSDVKELQRLVQQGCDINGLDRKFKFAPIHWAVYYGSIECLHWLLWHGADCSKQSGEGWAPVHVGAIRGRHLCLQSLAANGADMNILDSRGKTPAHLAASHGNTKCLQEILRKGLDGEIRDAMYWTATHTAAFHGRLGCLQVLSKWNFDMASLDRDGNTLAHLTAGEGHLACLKFLVSIAPSIEMLITAKNNQGDTPKDLAVHFSQKNCVQYLTTVEYDLEHPETSENFAYPAHNSAYNGDLEFLQMAINSGVASLNDRDERGSTPAHKAAGNGKVEVLQWLIEKGADVNILNDAGENPRDIALRFGQVGCIQLLGGDSDYEDEAADLDLGAKEPKVKEEAKGRALLKVEEIQEQLEIARLNFQHLGGVLPEDTERLKEQQESARKIRELEEQLEYERVRREKLECQLDALKAQLHNLTRELEETRLLVPKPPQELAPMVLELPKGKKKMRRIRPKSGVIMVQRTPGTFEPLSSSQSGMISPSGSPLETSSMKSNNSRRRRPRTAKARIDTAMSGSERGSFSQMSFKSDKESIFELQRIDSRNSHRTDSRNSHRPDSGNSHRTDGRNSRSESESEMVENRKELDGDTQSIADNVKEKDEDVQSHNESEHAENYEEIEDESKSVIPLEHVEDHNERDDDSQSLIGSRPKENTVEIEDDAQSVIDL